MVSSPVAVTTSDIAPISSKEFLDIQETIEFGFIRKTLRDVIINENYVSIIISSKFNAPIIPKFFFDLRYRFFYNVSADCGFLYCEMKLIKIPIFSNVLQYRQAYLRSHQTSMNKRLKAVNYFREKFPS